MRKAIILLLALALASLFALFPEVADATLSVHAFGWVFEARQGPFILALVLILTAYWLLRRIVLAILAGPGQLLHVLRNGRKKRREAYLHDGLCEWVDMRGERGWKNFRKSRGFLPDWADGLLERLPLSPTDIPLPSEKDDALLVALSARIATDPDAARKPDPAVRGKHLDAWLRVHPGAPLALERKANLLHESGDWKELVAMLEQIWQRGGNSASRTAPKLAYAYMQLATTASSESEGQENSLSCLRKAHRLQPESRDVVLTLGRALIEAGDAAACRKIWLAHIEQHDDADIAVELLPLMQDDALKSYRKMEKRGDAGMTPALSLLRAGIAHMAGLKGLAGEHMDRLLATHPSRQAWQVLGQWHAQSGDWKAAAEACRQALDSSEAGLTRARPVSKP